MISDMILACKHLTHSINQSMFVYYRSNKMQTVTEVNTKYTIYKALTVKCKYNASSFIVSV